MRLKPNEFSSYELTQQEEAQGWAFSPMTQAVLRNEQAIVAGEIVKARIEGKDKKEEEIKHITYLQGQLDVLRHILAQADLYSQDLDLMIQEDQNQAQLEQ